jgi:drug/metabolite transporter (DMT)-like permease
MTPPVPSRAWLTATGALLAALTFWSIVPLVLEFFTGRLDPWTVNGARYTVAAAFWLPFVLRGLWRMPPAGRRAVATATLAPAAAHVASQICFGLAPYYNNATMLNFGCRLSIPFATLFGFWLLKGERPLMRAPLFWIGLACALGGFLLMFRHGFGTDSTSARGMWILLGFSATWALYVVLVRRNLSGYPAPLAYGLVSLLTCLPLLALLFGRAFVMRRSCPRRLIGSNLREHVGSIFFHSPVAGLPRRSAQALQPPSASRIVPPWPLPSLPIFRTCRLGWRMPGAGAGGSPSWPAPSWPFSSCWNSPPTS